MKLMLVSGKLDRKKWKVVGVSRAGRGGDYFGLMNKPYVSGLCISQITVSFAALSCFVSK